MSGQKTKRHKDKEENEDNKNNKDNGDNEDNETRRQRPKREFNIVKSGQFRSLAMFYISINCTKPLQVLIATTSDTNRTQSVIGTKARGNTGWKQCSQHDLIYFCWKRNFSDFSIFFQ